VKLKTVNAPKISELNNLNLLKKDAVVELKEVNTGQKRILKFEYAIRYTPAKIFEHSIVPVKTEFPVAFKIWKKFSKFDTGDKIVFFDELAKVSATVKNIADFSVLMRAFGFYTGIKNNTIIDNDVVSKSLIEGQYKKSLPSESDSKNSHNVELKPKQSCEWQFALLYNYYKYFEVTDLYILSDITIKMYDGYRFIDAKKSCYFINLKQINFIVKIYSLVLLIVFLAITFAIIRFWVINV